MATVRGTFDLNSKPASSALRDLRAEGEETDAVFQSLGTTLDGVGTTKQREQVRLYKEAIKKLGSEWEKSAAKADASWDAMEKKTLDSVATQGAAIEALQERVESFGRTRASAAVNVDGVSESLAEVELLHRRLDALGRQRSTPSVGLGASSVGRTVAGGASQGGGGFSRGLNVPFAGSIPYPIVAGALGAAPPLLGGATALLGSAGSATLGAGAIGVGGLGALAAGIGSLATVAIPAVKGIKESSKALGAYNMAVAQNGKNSTQAHSALEKLNAVLQNAPAGTRGLLNQEQSFKSRFTNLTKPGQSAFVGSLSNLLGAGNQLAPQLSSEANAVANGVQQQSGRFSNFLSGKGTRAFLGSASAAAVEVLPDVDSTFQHVLSTLMNISRAAMPFFKQSVAWLKEWTGGWSKSSGNIDKTRGTISRMVDNLKSWGRLGGAGFDLIRDLLKPATGSGQTMVEDLTRQFDKWDRWLNKNPAKVKGFFAEAVQGTEKIAGAIGKITGLLFKVGRLLTPLLEQASQFVTFFSQAGLLTPNSLPLLLAGGSGVRNVVKTARGRILGGPASAESGLATAGTRAGTRASMSTEEALLLSGGVGAPAASTAARAGLFSRGRSFLGRVGSAGRVPVMSSTVGGLTMAEEADAGMIGATRFSASAAARYGLSEAGAGALGTGGAFLRGAGARFLPIAGLVGGLSAISTPGTIEERTQAAISSLTAGIVAPPKTAAQKEEDSSRHAQMVSDYYAKKYGGGVKGVGEQIMATRRKRNRLLTPQGESFGDLLNHGLIHDVTESGPSVSDETRKEAEALGKELDQLRELRREEKSIVKEKEAGRRAEREERGRSRSQQFAKSFDIRSGKEGGVAAFGDVAGPILQNIKHLGPAGGKALAENVLIWTRAAKQNNPQLKKQYEELVEGITHNFNEMGRRIKVINGEIYEGTSKEWAAIQKSMTNPIEQAREEMSASFTKIQQEAEHVLRAMGYSPSQAKNLVQSEEQGKPTKALAKEGATAHNHGQAGASPNNIQRQPHGARGMRIPGHGNLDHVPIGGSTGIGAPNELIVNNPTEERANKFLGLFGTSLEALQRSEKHKQSTPVGGNVRLRNQLMAARRFARGGRVVLDPGVDMSYGQEPAIRADLGRLAAELGESVYVISGYRSPAHSVAVGGFADDPHTRGEAADIGVGGPSLESMAGVTEAQLKAVGLYRPFYPADPHEVNHVQLLAGGAVGKLKGARGGGGGARGGLTAAQAIHLKRHRSALGGVPGALAEKASGNYAKALEQHVNKRLGKSPKGGSVSVPKSGGPVIAQIGRGLLSAGLNKIGAAGIIGNALQESGWDPGAVGSGGGGLWGFTASPYSLADVQAYAAQQNRPWDDASLQTQFLLKFLSPSLKSALNSSASPGAAAAYFMENWERPAVATENQARREEGARQAFAAGYAGGGRLPAFAGWFARGGSFTAKGPTLFGAGEGNIGEDVQIRPHGRPGGKASFKLPGGGGHQVEVKLVGPFHVRNDADIEAIADKVGKKLVAALNEADKVNQKDVIG